jgi:hypothetical protein
MIFGPFKGEVCTFCGTSDLFCYPSPAAELQRLGFDMSKVQTAETHPAACEDCCGMQEDGHEEEYVRGEARWACTRCDRETPSEFFDHID